ncbi:MAG: elongation factor P, partial [Verrucomicrobiales bacterium]
VEELVHKTPPNNRAYVQVAIRSLSTGKMNHLRFTPSDSVEVIPVTREEYEYSYLDQSGYHFLHSVTYDDIIVPRELVDGIKGYLVENQKYQVVFTNETVAAVEPPPAMEFVVAESPEGVKGDSSTNVFKSAKLETGLEVQVPLFIKPGERIRINTADGKYLGRA